jgi:hypothetical protein
MNIIYLKKVKIMKIEKPILFSTPMVQAILKGHKTQTRRIIKPQPMADLFSAIVGGYDNIPKMARFYTKRESCNPFIEDIKLKYNIGNILWVRETWHPKRHSFPIGLPYEYKATAKEDGNPTDEHWKPSIFMPKDACRIFLKIVNVRVQRLNDITEKDAVAEGITELLQSNTQMISNGKQYFDYSKEKELLNEGLPPIESYKTLWQNINGKESWDQNPFVWVYEFDKIEQ